jgi:hypothetical protein
MPLDHTRGERAYPNLFLEAERTHLGSNYNEQHKLTTMNISVHPIPDRMHPPINESVIQADTYHALLLQLQNLPRHQVCLVLIQQMGLHK